MMDTQDYAIAWSVYLACAVVLQLLLWLATRNGPKPLRKVVLTFSAALFFTPVHSSLVEGQDWLVPAFVQGAYELVQGRGEAAVDAFSLIGAVLIVLTLLQIFESSARRMLQRG